MSEHRQFECIIAQMRSLEALFLHDADKPLTGKDLLPLCEAIRLMAAKLAFDDTPLSGISESVQNCRHAAVE